MTTTKPPKTLRQAITGLWRGHRAHAVVLIVIMVWSLLLTGLGVFGSALLTTQPPYHS